MIVVRLMGGLGNQMFQYAAGRALAVRHRTVLKLDLSFLENPSPGTTRRKFILNRFPVVAEMAGSLDFPSLVDTTQSVVVRVRNAFLRFLRKQCSTTLLNFDHQINGLFFRAPDNTYLMGYWQSERYFRDNRDLLLKEFTVDVQTEGINAETTYQISRTCSVAIHIRRGDYVGTRYHGLCSPEYYERGMETMARTIGSPHFFVFSDEPEWVRENFSTAYPFTVVGHNDPDEPVPDLALMKLCKHQIIANSTFSWWGAWLNENPRKVVISPKRWFSDLPSDSIIPDEWIRI